MEKRMVLAIVLSMAVIMIFSYRNSQRLRDVRRHQPVTATSGQARDIISSATETATPGQTPLKQPPSVQETQEDSSRSVAVSDDPWKTLSRSSQDTDGDICVIESDLWRIEMTNKGAMPVSWKLPQFPEVFHDPRYLKHREKQASPPPVAPRLDVEHHLTAFLAYAAFDLDRKELQFYQTIESALKNPDTADSETLFKSKEELIWGSALYPASPILCRWGPDLWDFAVLYEGPSGTIQVEDEPVDLTYVAKGDGFKISKIFTFSPNTYRVNLRIRIENTGNTPILWKENNNYQVTWQGGITRPSTQIQRLNSVHIATSDGDILHFPKMPRKFSAYASVAKIGIADGNQPTTIGDFETLWHREYPNAGIRWIGVDSKYFLGAIKPQSPVKMAAAGLSRIPGDSVDYIRPAMGMELTVKDLTPGIFHEDLFDIYVGPKEGERLIAVDETLEELVQNYWMSTIVAPIARLLLHLLQFFYKIVPNYGIGIILLTFLVRLLMYPLYHKQMASMKKMQMLQPQINALKERHKDNPQELQKKTMEFYRAHKVNPMAGCLTMLPTLPIFIALWGTFNQAIELRGAPFIGWIQDLSQPDQAFFLPIAGHIIPINILPLMYCALMLWSQSRQKIETPNAGMMKMIPIVFVFFFWSIASGVILYFVVSMTVDTLQRLFMDKFGRQEVPTTEMSIPAPERVRKATGKGQSRRKR